MTKAAEMRLAFQVLSEIAIIGHLADTALAQTLPKELSVAGFGVLNHFVRVKRDGESPAKLARAFQVTKGAMTYTLQRLQALGYVAIAPDARDGRGKIVRITKAGRAARDAGEASVAPGMRAILSLIPAEDFAATLPLLTRLREILDAARD